MKHIWNIIIIAGMGISFFFGSLHIYGDGAGNYFLYRQIIEHNWTLSIADPPLDLPGAYIFARGLWGWSTYYQIGAPVVWALGAPFNFFLPDIPAAFSHTFGLPPSLLRDGLFILVLSSVLSAATVLLWARGLHRFFQFPYPVSVAATLASFVGLSSWYYAFLAPSYAHTVELFFLTWALYCFFSALPQPAPLRFAACGLLTGIAALVRIDAVLYAAVFAWVILVRFRRAALRPLAALTASCGAAVGIQFFVWFYVFGEAFPSVSYRPDSFTLPLHVADVLFSGSRGFFIWSPLAIIGCVGSLLLLRGRRFLPWTAGVMGALVLIAYALFFGAWGMWWGGLSFGQRFLIPLFPFVALGVAVILRHLQAGTPFLRHAGMWVVGTAAVYTLALAWCFPTVAQWGSNDIEKDATPPHVLQSAYRRYAPHDVMQWKNGWRAWYNATPRPAHLLSTSW